MSARLGTIRGATIVCHDLAETIAMYAAGFGWQQTGQGTVPDAQAAGWGAPGLAGAASALFVSPDAASFLRLVEDRAAPRHAPFASLGWNALEISVADAAAAVARMTAAGFTVLAPAADLAFSEGALCAGQVLGPSGEAFYLTQINRQVDDFVLPVATAPLDRLFIAVLGMRDVGEGFAVWGERFGTLPKPRFTAAVDFVSRFQGLPEDTPIEIGCVETGPCSYIEIDASPAHVGARMVPEGRLPAGIAMVAFAADDPAAFAGEAFAPAARDPLAGFDSIVVTGGCGERIEIVAA